ncbi:hypothetical protein HYPSUDRAFT_33756 [Hypholoma sublateritium FD-334 SS-4]|uniref:Uncharacterized protein n=1 Tax=Hypholoma sublateritium (strain FD-334 SS-4) TaxID=945553 RepID=A0A0D2LKS7_HYPSF|nr:hypothetical protein HYPSUDRAFT_33756 [Hypholoma sublateritium FD-334 SS-4]
MSPRPILKPFPAPPLFLDLHSGDPNLSTPYSGALPFASCHIPPAMSPHVHFPATPALTQCEMTYSSRSYDRKSIEVLPNALGLPARGERDVDHGYFFPVRRCAVPEPNDMDVDYSPPSSSSPLVTPFDTPSPLLRSRSPIYVFDQSTESPLDEYDSAERPTSISLSFHFSPSHSSGLTRKRNPQESQAPHRRKKRMRTKECHGPPRNTTDFIDGKPDVGGSRRPRGKRGYGLGLESECVLNRTPDDTDSDSDECSRSASSISFSSSFDPAFEGCLGGF